VNCYWWELFMIKFKSVLQGRWHTGMLNTE